jgi:hypothetical protein
MTKPLLAKQDMLLFMRQLYDDMGFSNLKSNANGNGNGEKEKEEMQESKKPGQKKIVQSEEEN